jgi:hypothetical protein
MKVARVLHPVDEELARSDARIVFDSVDTVVNSLFDHEVYFEDRRGRWRNLAESLTSAIDPDLHADAKAFVARQINSCKAVVYRCANSSCRDIRPIPRRLYCAACISKKGLRA